MTRQILVSCSPTSRATALTGMAVTMAISGRLISRIAVPPVSPPDLPQRDAGGDGYQGRFAPLTRWPAAILDTRHRPRAWRVRPGRRNGAQPNKETAEGAGGGARQRFHPTANSEE